MVQHTVTHEIANDHMIFAQKCQFARTCDQKYHGSSQAFSKVKGKPPATITEVYLPVEADCIPVWKHDLQQIECFCEDPSAFTGLAPVKLLQSVGWIIQHDGHSFTVQFHPSLMTPLLRSHRRNTWWSPAKLQTSCPIFGPPYGKPNMI